MFSVDHNRMNLSVNGELHYHIKYLVECIAAHCQVLDHSGEMKLSGLSEVCSAFSITEVINSVDELQQRSFCLVSVPKSTEHLYNG